MQIQPKTNASVERTSERLENTTNSSIPSVAIVCKEHDTSISTGDFQ